MSALSALRRTLLSLCLGAFALLAVGPLLALTPGEATLDKQCGAPVVLLNGDYAVDCVLSLAVEARSGPMLSDIRFYLQDVVSDAGGTPQPGWITNAPGCTPMPGNGPGWDCPIPAILWQDTIPNAVTVPLTTVSLVIPADTEGPVENCVALSQRIGFPMPGNEPPAELVTEACDTITLPLGGEPPLEAGGQCLAFTAEVTCDASTGQPVITLSNAYSGLFSPEAVRITALTSGVSVVQGNGPMSLIVSGAAPGDTVTLLTEAVQPGAGSVPGLDLCCMGEIEVEIPVGLTCEIETTLTVEKTCTAGEYPSGANADCEITVTYDGPPPSATNPLVLSDSVSNGAWNVEAFMGSTHNWSCDPTPHAGPAPWVCEITATDEPGTDWSNFTSTIVLQMSTDDLFENCAEAEVGGLTDQGCWSNIPSSLVIDKTGPEVCDADGLCDYQITLTAGAGGYFGSVLLSDHAPAGFQITAISPAIPGCMLPANPMSCPVSVGLLPSVSQTYTVTIQRDGTVEGPIAGNNCAAAHGLPSGALPGADALAALLQDDPMTLDCVPIISDDEPCEEGFALVDAVCEPLESEDPSYTLEKTCEMGDEAILCTITLATNGVPFAGDIVVSDVSNLIPGGAHTISAPVGTCSDTTMACTFNAADLAGLTPPNTVQIAVMLDATSMEEGFMNCALGSNAQMGPERDCMINGEFEIPKTPPPPNATCSSNYIFVVDSSGSIGANAGDVSVAVRNMAQILNGNGSQASLILFNSNAALTQPMSVATLNGMANNYGMLFAPSGATNWEAALALAEAEAAATPNSTIIFITDGRPTAHLDGSGVPVILPSGPATWLTATNEAIPVVNSIYGSGTPIIGIGIAGPGEGSFVSTYLDALLGVSTAGSTFASLNADMTALAYTLCADLHVTKLINGGSQAAVNFNSIAGPSHPLTITLRALNSTAADLTNVVIEDVLPANLTNPTNILPAGALVSISGQTVTWTVPLIAAGATESITFQVDLARPAPEVTNCSLQTNFAQVQLLTGSIQSTPGNMNPTAGPDAEPDEGSARYCAFDRPSIPPDCTGQYLEVRKTAVEEACFVGQPCEFSVNVRPRQCSTGGFDGAVMFADSVTAQGGGSVATTVTSVTNNHTAPICAFPADWTGTTTPIGCATNVTLPQNTSITFNVTLTAPAAGDYTQCFVAQNLGLPTTPAAALAAVNPPTLPNNWIPRGNCVNFSVSAPAGIAPEGPTGETRSTGPVLTITKTLQDACRTLTASRRHECDFALVVTNTGDAPFAGPVALSDVVAGITPMSAQVQSTTGWSCDMRGATASCVNGAVMLNPGQSTGFVMTLSLPANPRTTTFEQCAALGVGPGEAERVLLAQRVMQFFGIDGGPVDGVSGRQTRAGLRQLAERLGLAPVDSVTPDLLAALGLGDAGAPVCVRVDLPAVNLPATPPPPTVAGPGCDAATTVARGDACVCRFEGMVLRNAQRCGCADGQRFEAGRGCVRGAPSGDPTPTGLRCDPQTTVRVGDACECRAVGMIRRNATSCSCPQGTQLLGGLGCVGLQVPDVAPRMGP